MLDFLSPHTSGIEPQTETTPLPAALPLFATGLGALGLLGLPGSDALNRPFDLLDLPSKLGSLLRSQLCGGRHHGSACQQPFFATDLGERLPVVVAHDEASLGFFDNPGGGKRRGG